MVYTCASSLDASVTLSTLLQTSGRDVMTFSLRLMTIMTSRPWRITLMISSGEESKAKMYAKAKASQAMLPSVIRKGSTRECS